MLRFESLLERDYMILLEFDDTVERFEEQPVKILFKKGVKPYVPDVLIHYSPGHKDRNPLLAEVKHTTDLKKNRAKYAPKFEQAKSYARNRDWEFRIVTEKESRVPRLKVLKFLREYQYVEPEPGDIDRVIDVLHEADKSIPLDVLLERLCGTDAERLQLVPTIWHLVVKQRPILSTSQRPIFSTFSVF